MTLNVERRMTSRTAAHRALNPATIMPTRARPTMEQRNRESDHSPWKTKPMNKKMRRMRPTSWKLESKGQLALNRADVPHTHYFFRSLSLISGRPANAACDDELPLPAPMPSLRTIMRPPATETLRRKKSRSKMRPAENGESAQHCELMYMDGDSTICNGLEEKRCTESTRGKWGTAAADDGEGAGNHELERQR